MPEQPQPHGRLHKALLCSALVLLTAFLYSPVRSHEFISYDDTDYTLTNPHVITGLTLSNLEWAFTHSWSSNWHPLTWISHMLDCQLFGPNPAGPHLVNVALHAANSVLLFLLLTSMTSAFWRSAFVAALFAWHPLHVESVAWVAERKDVLSSFFALLTVAAFLRYTRPTSTRARTTNYLLALLFFAFGLMSKPMVVTLPFVLLLLDYWPLDRLKPSGRTALRSSLPLLTEKLPFFLLSLASSIVTLLVQQRSGAVSSTTLLPFSGRIANAIVAYAAYLEKTFWPADLAIIYPFTTPNSSQLALSSALLICFTVLVFTFARRLKFLPVGWLWFLGTLVPVIGLVQVGPQSFADRYTYLPLVGLCVMIAWSLGYLVERTGLPKVIPVSLSSCAVAACVASTAHQLTYWKNDETLLTHTLRVTSTNNAVAHFVLGNSRLSKGDLDGAAREYEETLRASPDYTDARNNYGVVLLQQHKIDLAVKQFQISIGREYDSYATHNSLANALLLQGRLDDSIAEYQASLRLNPDFPLANNGLAWLRATCPDAKYRDGAEAVRLAAHAVELTASHDPAILDTLAAALAESGRFYEAIQVAEQARTLAASSQQPHLADEISARLELYRKNQPYRTLP